MRKCYHLLLNISQLFCLAVIFFSCLDTLSRHIVGILVGGSVGFFFFVASVLYASDLGGICLDYLSSTDPRSF